jgi:hypothetical protein
MKRIIGTLISCTAFVYSALWAEVPKPMVDNVSKLTEAAAVLIICFESEEYKKLPTEKALKLHGLSIRLTNLVEKISKHYNDESLLLTYELMKVEMSSDPDLKEYVRKEYQCCGDALFREMEVYVSENEKVIEDFISKKEKQKGKTPWPKSAKAAYVERCVASMVSQGLPKRYARPYCVCIADGMEKEFGMEEYDHMMKAQPNPEGSSYDKRLYEVFSSCSDILPE